jgi:hypothetical protein
MNAVWKYHYILMARHGLTRPPAASEAAIGNLLHLARPRVAAIDSSPRARLSSARQSGGSDDLVIDLDRFVVGIDRAIRSAVRSSVARENFARARRQPIEAKRCVDRDVINIGPRSKMKVERYR